MKLTCDGLAKALWIMALFLTGCGGGGGSTTVEQPTLSSISISPASATIAKGLTTAFVATALYSDSTTADITSQATWATADATIAAIASSTGIATGNLVNTTSVTASLDGVTSDPASLTITDAVITGVSISPTAPIAPNGMPVTFTATGTYSDGTFDDISATASWLSSDTAVAMLDASGVAATLTLGETSVTATANNITSNSATLTVTAAVITAIEISPATPSTPKGVPVTFTATGTFSDNTNGNISGSVTWASSDTGVATLDSSGVASSLAQGTTDITALANAITSNSATLTVTAPELASLSIAAAVPSTPLGTQLQYTASGVMTDGTAAILGATTWASSDLTVATISAAGLVTTVSPGSTNISASSGGLTSSDSVLDVVGYPTGYVAQGNLIWTPVTTTTYNWTNASAYCNTAINGQPGWRMPTVAELSALYASGVMNGHGWSLGLTWSSTPGAPGTHTFFALNIGGSGAHIDTTPNFVSCVR